MTQRAPKIVAVEADAHCRNCGAVLAGSYCQSCGQRADSAPSFRQLLHEWVHEYLEVDGKIFRTLRLLLFSPGALTKEFLEGRRVRYISPIRLYLISSVAYFWLLTVTPQPPPQPMPESPALVSRARAGGSEFADRLLRAATNLRRDRTPLLEKLTKWWPTVMFVLVPVFGVLIGLAYRKAVRFYLPHLYFAIHAHAFIFLVLFAAQLLRTTLAWLTGTSRSVALASFDRGLKFLVLPYVILALHRVYGGTWSSAIVRGIATLVGYAGVVFAALVVVGIAAVITLM